MKDSQQNNTDQVCECVIEFPREDWYLGKDAWRFGEEELYFSAIATSRIIQPHQIVVARAFEFAKTISQDLCYVIRKLLLAT
jgi:hypothetical protein